MGLFNRPAFLEQQVYQHWPEVRRGTGNLGQVAHQSVPLFHLETTQRYLLVDSEWLQQAVDKLPENWE
jgi:hypothetical protein